MVYQSNTVTEGWQERHHHICFLHVMFRLNPSRLSLGNSLIEAPVSLGPGRGELSGAGQDQTLHLPSHLLRLTPSLGAPGHHGLALLLPGLGGTLGGDILTSEDGWRLSYKLLENTTYYLNVGVGRYLGGEIAQISTVVIYVQRPGLLTDILLQVLLQL